MHSRRQQFFLCHFSQLSESLIFSHITTELKLFFIKWLWTTFSLGRIPMNSAVIRQQILFHPSYIQEPFSVHKK